MEDREERRTRTFVDVRRLLYGSWKGCQNASNPITIDHHHYRMLYIEDNHILGCGRLGRLAIMLSWEAVNRITHPFVLHLHILRQIPAPRGGIRAMKTSNILKG